MRRQTIYPVLRYRDPSAAIEWLGRAFGFTEHAVYRGEDGGIAHAQVALGGEVIMIGPSGPEGPDRGMVYILHDDPDGVWGKAREAGAKVVHELADQDYGAREFTVADPEGHQWSVGTYRP